MTRQATDNLYIDLGYFTPEEYYTYQAEAQASVSAQASMSVNASVIREASVTLQVTASVSATISHIMGADLFAFGEAQLSAAVDAIRDYSLEADAQFDIATDGRVFRDIQSAETSLFDFAVIYERSRDVLSETQAAFSFECEATRISANIEAEASLSVEFAQTVLNDRIRYADSNISVESSLTATISHIEGVDIVLLPFANMTTAADIFRDVDAQLSIDSAVSISSGLLNLLEAQLDSRFNFYVSRYTGSGRPKHLTSLTPLIFSTIAKFGSHSLQSGKSTFLYENTPPRPGQDWVIEGWAYQRFSSRTRINSWTLSTEWGEITLTQAANNPTINLFAYTNNQNNEADYTVNNLKVDVYITTGSWVHIAYVQSGSTRSVYINGTRRATGPAATAYRKDSFNYISVGDTSTTNWLIDEASVRVGDTYGFNAANSSITVPTAARTNDPATTQFLYHFNNEALDDIIIPVETSIANLNATATITATLSGPQRFDPVSYAVTSAMSVVGTKTTEIILSAFNDAALIAEVGLEQNAQADLAIAVTSSVQAQITAEAISTQSADSQLSSEVIRIQQGAAEFDAVSAQMSVVAVIAEGIVFQEILSFMAVSAVKTTNSVALPTSATNLTALESVFRDNSSDIYFEFQQLSLINKIGEASAQISLEFQQTVDADLNADAIVLQAGEFSLSADASGSAIGVAAELTVDAYLTAEALRIQQIDSQQSSDFELTANTLNSLVAFGEADLNADTQLEGQALRIQQGIIQTDSISVQMIVVLVSRDVDVAMTATSTLTSSAVKTTEVDSVISASVEQISFTDRTRDFNSLLDTTVEVNAAATKDTDIQVELFATFIQSAQGYKTTEIVLVAFDDAEMTSGVNVIAGAAANMPVSTNIPILTVERTRYGTVAMDLAADLLNNITVDYSPFLQFEANTSVTANLNVLHLDLHVYRIPREQRAFVIDNEQRNYRISSETRTFKVRR